MPITRETIITAFQTAFDPDPDTLALWMEGADATGWVDAYSDIDLDVSVRPGTMDAATARAQATLEALGVLDLIQPSTREADHQATTYHLAGTSPYLLIDFDVFVERGSTFTTGDEIEKPLVLFDRAGVVRFTPPGEQTTPTYRAERLRDLENTVAQSARVEKYVLRGQFLEAFGYYHKYLLLPLIEALRLHYTPIHPEFSIIHITRHLPADEIARLEALFQVASLEDLGRKSQQARAYFANVVETLRQSS
jgi:hypothetical protein